MFCEKCGTKNEVGAKFCEKCGYKIESVNEEKRIKVINEIKGKYDKIPKKTKIITGTVILVIIAAIITLCILLNNPVKKVEDSLESYYANYSDNSNEELVEIGKVLKNNKEKEKVLNNIKETTHRAMEKWVKNFNTDYKNTEELDKSYKKVSGALKDIYDYFNGLEYMLDYELYNEYYENLRTLYYSKQSYLNAKKYESEDNDYYAYYYYQKVAEEDNYYKKAQEYITTYVKDELEAFKGKIEDFIKLDEKATDKEILDAYISQIKYLNSNKTSNNIDLSSTDYYKKIYEEASKNIVKYTKKVVEEYAKDLEYNEAIKIIEKSMDELEKDSDYYKELSELQKEYKNKLPDSLLSKYLVSSTWGSGASNYTKEINDEEYDSNISFQFEGETQSRVYRLNGEYKKLKTTIIRGSDWDKDFTGYFVISGDDKELYKSEAITKNSELIADIDINVTGVDDLKIEFVTKSKPDGWDNFYIYLVEPYLYK